MLLIALAMLLMTIASQMEIFALGVLTRKDPLPTGSDNFFQKAYNTVNGLLAIDGNISRLAAFMIFVALFKAVTMFFQRYSTRCLAIKISRDLRLSYFEHIQSLPMSFYQRFDTGTLASRVVGDAALISEALNACLINYIQTPFVVITTLTICFMTSWQLSLLVFLGLPLIGFPIAFLAKGVKRLSRQIQRSQEQFTSALIDFLSGILTVKVFRMEPFTLNKYREHNDKMASLEERSAKYDLLTRPIVHTIAMFFLAAALIYGIYILDMGVSEIFFFCGMLYLFYEPIKKFAEENSHIQRGVAAAERLFEVMHMQPEIVDAADAETIGSFQDAIEFDNVWFRYQETLPWVLRGLSFSVKKGEMVAIVGATGAGKSTVVQLLPRLWDVSSGAITVDGKAVQCYTQESLRKLFAFVPQKPFLFLDTVARNISGGSDYTQERLVEAAKKAQAEEFIVRLKDSYETLIAEGGKDLSGGQQQRLAIARALFAKSPILIMDEATSSLDAISEEKIKQAIDEIHGEVTQIIIAHRLSTIEHADKIIFLEQGQKIAEGTKEELLATCPPFQAMWHAMRLSSAI
jgi:ABC-type multidrug transport system fused ATPase/permease subunit